MGEDMMQIVWRGWVRVTPPEMLHGGFLMNEKSLFRSRVSNWDVMWLGWFLLHSEACSYSWWWQVLVSFGASQGSFPSWGGKNQMSWRRHRKKANQIVTERQKPRKGYFYGAVKPPSYPSYTICPLRGFCWYKVILTMSSELLKGRKGGKQQNYTKPLLQNVLSLQEEPSWGKAITHAINYPWDSGWCAGRGVENGETLSQSQAEDCFFPGFSDSLRAESRLFLSLYPECLAYCKSSINKALSNRNKSFVEFPCG